MIGNNSNILLAKTRQLANFATYQKEKIRVAHFFYRIVILALRSTFEDLIGSLPLLLPFCKK